MNDALSTQVVVGVAVAYVLQWLKRVSWFPVLTEQSTKGWKILLSGILAAGSALAIGFQWNGAAGELLITGLTGAAILNALIAFGVSFISQHASYELLIHKGSLGELIQQPASLISDAAKILDQFNRQSAKPIAKLLIVGALGFGLAGSPGCAALHHETSTPTVEQQSLTDLHKTAQVAKRAGEIVSETQQLEIKGYQLGKIAPADHKKIQAGFGAFAHGVIISLQEAQDMTKPNANRQAAINKILDGADRFVTEYVLPIKDESLRTGIQLGLATLRGVLNAMQLLL